MNAYDTRTPIEALRRALELRNEAYRATPVRDDTRNAHFALEELRIVLTQALRHARASDE